MKLVTKVSQQRRPGRYNIYLDDTYAFAVDEKVLISYNLFKGTQLDDAMIEDVLSAEYEQKAYTRALVYATGQLRPKKQVIHKLKEYDYPKDIIARVIERLEKTNVLDDQQYAEAYIRTVSETGKVGPIGAKYKLRELGLTDDMIEDALIYYDYDREVEHVERLIEKYMNKYQRQARYLAEQKTRLKLVQLGFSVSTITNTLQIYRDALEDDTDQEWENLNDEAERLVSRYQQYTGWEFTRRFKGAMFRKGYQLSDVDRWLYEHPQS